MNPQSQPQKIIQTAQLQIATIERPKPCLEIDRIPTANKNHHETAQDLSKTETVERIGFPIIDTRPYPTPHLRLICKTNAGNHTSCTEN